jgi:hypothetical protein
VPEDDDDRVPCKHCGRKFAEDRVGKHMEICGGIKEKKGGWKGWGGGKK